jgi:hypothetical protein
MSGSRERIAANQAVFRAINERMSAWPERRQAGANAKLTFYCECGEHRCFEHVQMTVSEYEAVRSHSARFVVARDHVFLDAENVVEEDDGYMVVEKHGDLHRIVEAADPRRPILG